MQDFRQRRKLALSGEVAAHSVPVKSVDSYGLKNRARARSAELCEAVHSIDTRVDPAGLQTLMRWLAQEYASRQVGQLLGLFGRCYLGEPYVDHQVSVDGHILKHFTPADHVPPGFAPARPLVRSDSYVFVEVYSDGQIIPIRPDGTPVV